MRKRGTGIILCALGVGMIIGLIMQGWAILIALIFFLVSFLLLHNKGC